MPTLNLRESARTAMAQGIIDDAGTNAKLRIYDGTKPAAGAAITTETLLAEMTFGGALGTASAGDLDFNVTGLSDASADATGTATWARVVTSGDAWVMDMDVSTVAANTGALQMDDTSIQLGGAVTINASSLTMPNA